MNQIENQVDYNGCHGLSRELTEQEKESIRQGRERLAQTGKCESHLCLRLFGPGSGPIHGCVICGEAIA